MKLFLKQLLICLLFLVVYSANGQGGAPAGAPVTTPPASTLPPNLSGRTYNPFEKHIRAVFDKIKAQNRYVGAVSAATLSNELPMGIVRRIGNIDYILAIDSASRKGGVWVFSAYMAVNLPKTGPNSFIAFAARNIVFNPQGIGGASNSFLSATRLELVSTNTITLSDDLSVEFSKTAGVSNNYIEFDCNGYKSISLEGKFKFSEGLLIPAVVPTTGSGDIEPPAPVVPAVAALAANKPKVTATFRIMIEDLSNVLVTASITPFKVKGLKDFIFEVQDASLDMSDLINPTSFAFPAGYTGGYAAGTDVNLWQGFHLKLLKITFLGVKSTNTKPPVSIVASNVLIDDSGISGLFEATGNILSIGDGSAGGWAVSIDHLRVQLVQNNLMGAGMEGKLKVPFLGENPMSYEATMNRVNGDVTYTFGIKLDTAETYEMPIGLVAKMRAGTSITVTRANGTTTARAVLTGLLTSTQANTSFSGIAFQNVIVTSASPYVTGGTFSLVSTTAPKCRGFGISLTQIGLFTVNPTQSKFTVRAGVNFTDSGSVTVSAAATIDFFVNTNTMTEATGLQRRRWQLDRISVNNIAISCHTNAFRLDGTIAVYENDPVYGDGFKGGITLGIKDYDFGATIYFGTKAISSGSTNTFRYFGVVAFGKGFNLACPAPFFITGIMGGFAYKMRNGSFNPDFSQLNAPGAAVSGVGYESSAVSANVNFIPDPTFGILFKAGINFKVGTMPAEDAPVTGDAMLEVAFSSSGSLNYIRFQGAAYFMNDETAKNARAKGVAADISQKNYGTLAIMYDHTNKCFHAVIDGYLNAGVIRGNGPNNKLGQVVIHIDPANWYVYLGKSSDMLGATIYGIASVHAYFMIGTVVEGMPLLPAAVRNALSLPITDPRGGQSGNLQSGAGFAFGVHLGASFGGDYSVFYARLNILAGLDVLILNLPSTVSCAGRPGRPGIDGWFAQGQIYVFVGGSVGIRARGRRIDIASMTMAALMQFKGPNPTWFAGNLLGSYSVLCGLVSGSFNFRFDVGEKCTLVSSTGSEVTIKVIENMKPDAAATAVSVFAMLQASFNIPVEAPFKMADANDVEGDYRVFVSEFSCKNAGQAVVGTYSWNSTKKVYSFRSTDILPPNATLNLKVVVRWEKLQGTTWVTLNRTDGTPETEMLQSTFTTGAAPQDIYNNVKNAYPIKNQYNFYKNEASSGFANLNVGQPYLFAPTDTDGKSWRFEARFKDISSTAAPLITGLSYDNTVRKVSIGLPTNLVSNKIYKMLLVKIPVNAPTTADNTQTTVTTTVVEGGTTAIAANQLQNTLSAGEKVMYEIHFRTSNYPTFTAKMSAYGAGRDLDFIAGNQAFYLYKDYLSVSETLDDFEIDPYVLDGPTIPALTSLEASSSGWLNSYHKPVIYDTYPQAANITISRNPTFLGLIPLKGVYFNRVLASRYVLDPADVNTGIANGKSGGVRLDYLVPFFVRFDADELRGRAVASYLNASNNPPAIQNLIAYLYRQITPGNYTVTLKYTLPDGTVTAIIPLNIVAN